MGRIVRADDFEDRELDRFLKGIQRLDYGLESDTPAWLVEEAEAYSRKNPKPSHDELRRYITISVQNSMGWDDPDEPEKMLHSALKMFYLLEWLEHLWRAEKRRKVRVGIQGATKVRFTPAFNVD